MRNTTQEPKGVDLLAKLLDLLAEQEGVRIEYTIERSIHNEHNLH